MRVAILAKGKTLSNYSEGFDEVWGLNQLGMTHDLDKLFVMDDLKQRMPIWDPMLPEWLQTYEGEIVTSRVYEEWPTAIRFPIEAVAKHFGLPLGISFYSTVDYMIALAIFQGMSEIHLFGVDCADPKREETVRCSIARWIAVAQNNNIKVITQDGSFFHWFTVTGICYENGLYGYAGAPRIENLARQTVHTENQDMQNSRCGDGERSGI